MGQQAQGMRAIDLAYDVPLSCVPPLVAAETRPRLDTHGISERLRALEAGRAYVVPVQGHNARRLQADLSSRALQAWGKGNVRTRMAFGKLYVWRAEG